MHQPLLSLASYSHVNASRAFTMAAINVQSFFPYRPSLKKLSTGSHGNEFKFYFSREKSTLPFSYVSSLPTREHVRDVYFLNVFSYIYIQYRQDEALELTVSSPLRRLELTTRNWGRP